MCIDQNHEMKLVDTVEKFFTCLACKWHNKVLHSKFPKACKYAALGHCM
jgi:hypothetical protein